MKQPSDTQELYTMIAQGDTYLENKSENAVIKITRDGTFVKVKGLQEFKAKPGSNLVAEAMLELAVIAKEKYDSF